jgi:hypothetical protein
MKQCSHCKTPIEGVHSICKYPHDLIGCPCTLHLHCPEEVKADCNILLKCGCHHLHIDSFVQVKQAMPAQYENTMEVYDKNVHVTKFKVENGWIKIGQLNEHEKLEWEARRDILVKYQNSWEKVNLYS